MFTDEPRGLKHPTDIAERRQMLSEVESVQPLRKWTADLVARRGADDPTFLEPHFDRSTVSIGPRADEAPVGSSFVSCC